MLWADHSFWPYKCHGPNPWQDKNISKKPTMIIFISDKKMGGKDKENSHPKRSLANIFEVQLWRKRKNFHIFLRFNFNGTSFSFDNVLLNSVTANQDQGSIGRSKAFRLKDDLWTRTVPGRVVPSHKPLIKTMLQSQFYFVQTGSIGLMLQVLNLFPIKNE